MKRKIFTVLTILILLLSLTSCKSSRKVADEYHKVNLSKGETELISAINDVEDSIITIAFADTSFMTRYTYMTGVIYKYDESSKYYYAATALDSTVQSASTSKSYLFTSDDTMYSLEKYRYDSYNSIAVVRFKSSATLKVASIKDTTTDVGTQVFSLYTKKTTSSSMSSTSFESGFVYSGVVSRNTGRLLQHTALPSSDAIGSPLFDYDGNLVGVNTTKTTGDSTSSKEHTIYSMNYAVSNESLNIILNDIESLFTSAINFGVSRFNFNCGYEYRYRLNESDTQVFSNLPTNFQCGLYITSVSSDNSFRNSISKGDYVYEINGKSIGSMDVLLNELYLHTKNDKIEIKLYRLAGTSYVSKTITN